MIDLFSEPLTELSADSVCDYLKNEFSAVGQLDEEELNPLSTSLALSLSEYVAAEHVSEDELKHPMIPLMISRCLWHLGYEESAQHILDHTALGAAGEKVSLYLHSACPLRLSIVRWIQQGVLCPVKTSLTYHNVAWQLNLLPFQKEQVVEFELERGALLKTMIETIAILYDHAEGDRILYLRRSSSAGGVNWPDADVLSFVEACLEVQRSKRGWKELPHLILLVAGSARAA